MPAESSKPSDPGRRAGEDCDLLSFRLALAGAYVYLGLRANRREYLEPRPDGLQPRFVFQALGPM